MDYYLSDGWADGRMLSDQQGAPDSGWARSIAFPILRYGYKVTEAMVMAMVMATTTSTTGVGWLAFSTSLASLNCAMHLTRRKWHANGMQMAMAMAMAGTLDWR